MKHNTAVLFWSTLAVLIFTKSLASPLLKALSNSESGISVARSVWIMSGNSRSLIRVRGTSVDGNGVKTDESAKLELESKRYNGSVYVRIRSVTENSYLCVNDAGDLTVEVHGNIFTQCLFTEDTFSGYRTFQSIKNSTWYLGFKRSGKVKQPHNTTFSQKAARFVRYFSLSSIP
ncbi:fibroblast growth factor 2 [Pocillopora verrucosa]|uniref:fibroblast growth factor 2 n=1 Tax=Pocillopora verrucosa TaxID=203993 RepID=UPI00333FC509